MTTIDQIRKTLSALVSEGGVFVLGPSCLGDAPAQTAFKRFLVAVGETGTLTFSSRPALIARFEDRDGATALQGPAILTLPDGRTETAEITVAFLDEDGALGFRILRAFSQFRGRTVAPAPWLTVDSLSVMMEQAADAPFTTVVYRGVVTTGPTAGVRLAFFLRAVDGLWEAGLGGAQDQPLSLSALLALIGGDSADSITRPLLAPLSGLPPSLKEALDVIALTGLRIRHDPRAPAGASRFPLFSMGLVAKKQWAIVPQTLVLKDPGVSLVLLNGGTPESATYITVNATALIQKDGKTVFEAPFFVHRAGGPGVTWRAGLVAGRVLDVAGLAELLGVVDDATAATMKDAFKSVRQIAIDRLVLSVTEQPSLALSGFSFAARAEGDWPVVADRLALTGLRLVFDLVKQGDRWAFSGAVCGTFRLAETLDLWVRVSGGGGGLGSWGIQMLAARDAGMSLSTLAGAVGRLAGVTLTAQAWPEVTVSDLGIRWARQGQDNRIGFTGAVAFTSQRSFLGQASLTIDAGYSSPGGLSASINGHAVLGTVTVTVTATIAADKPWSLVAEVGADSDPIDLVTLVRQGAQMLGLDPPAPAALPSIGVSGLRLDWTTAGESQEGSFTGDIQIGESRFAIRVELGATRKRLSGTWRNGTLSLVDLAAAFGIPGLSSDLAPTLTGASLSCDFSGATTVYAITASTANGRVMFCSVTTDRPADTAYLLGIDAYLGVTLDKLPLIGGKVPDGATLGLERADLWVLSGADAGLATALDAARTLDLGTLQLPADGARHGMRLNGSIKLGGPAPVPLKLAFGGDPPAKTAAKSTTTSETNTKSETETETEAETETETETKTVTPPPPSGEITWMPVQKSVSVLRLDRIGAGYANNQLTIAFDAVITVGPLTFSLFGLGVRSPISRFTPCFELSGLGLSYRKPPIELSGSFLKVDPPPTGTRVQFSGSAVIATPTFSLGAIGSYAELTSGEASFFIFGSLTAVLGGPPAFFVTGLSAGFGYNRKLGLPGQDEVQDFPLLALPSPSSGGSAPSLAQVLTALEGRGSLAAGVPVKPWLVPHAGACWAAAGVRFTSFRLIETRALLVATFGAEFELALLGLSTLRLPVGVSDRGRAFAQVEIQVRAVVRPAKGEVEVTGRLGHNSYILSPDCALSGGFAFSVWFAPHAQAGAFVLTLGGYHPAFLPPPHYPKVPRLEINWPVSAALSIKGAAYFALTPSCIMTGGALEIVFQSGSLRAWFIAHADFLASWNPFFYSANVSVAIGISYQMSLGFCEKTIGVSVSAALQLWGPPTGGVVDVDIAVTSFTIRFGTDRGRQADIALDWPAFKALLPAPSQVCTISATRGLAGTRASSVRSGAEVWVIQPGRFALAVGSAVPAGTIVCRAARRDGDRVVDRQFDGPNRTIDIRPMDRTGVTATLTVKITANRPDGAEVDLTGWDLTPIRRPLPASLWGKPATPFRHIPDSPTNDLVPDLFCGLALQTPALTPTEARGIVRRETLQSVAIMPHGRLPLAVPGPPGERPNHRGQPDTAGIGLIASAMTAAPAAQRQALAQALARGGLFTGPCGALTALAAGARTLYADSPLICRPPPKTPANAGGPLAPPLTTESSHA